MIIKEKSCGGVVFYLENNKPLFLIEKMIQGHYSIPKGHIEEGEDDLKCALREIKEETNLDVIYHPGFMVKKTYSPKEGILKDVYFYLFETKSKEVIPQEIELTEIYFLEYDKAMDLLTYESDKDVLLKGYNAIKELMNIN